MRQPGGVAYSILAGDWAEHVEESLQYGGGIFWGNPGLLYGQEWSIEPSKKLVQSALDSGVAFQADTLEELAEKAGMPAEAFKATVARYNENCHAGIDRDFGKRKELLYPLEKGPFIALKQGTALLSVVGGLSISTHMEVLDKDRHPIPGLYAVGDTTGGMYGHEYVTTILGNSHGRAMTWGYLAAARIAGVE
jgi:succinate dehydrogenase/fumarate reductase flavoprotein subunit